MRQFEFKIEFDVAIENSNIIVPLAALAELHHSEPYYVLRSVEVVRETGHQKALPFAERMEIKRVERDNEYVWVHCDTGKESEISRSAGKAIEQANVGINSPRKP